MPCFTLYTHYIFNIFISRLDRLDNIFETQNNTLMLSEKNFDYDFIYITLKTILFLNKSKI